MCKILETIAKQMSRYPCVEKVILFGSRTRGNQDDRFDIDLAVACPGASDSEWTTRWNDVDDASTLLSISSSGTANS